MSIYLYALALPGGVGKKGVMIQILAHDPKWIDTFQEIVAVVGPVLGDVATSIEHVGSTSVPGLYAKPVIDIAVIVGSKQASIQAIKILESLGYQHRGDLGIRDREAFSRPINSPRHNLYVTLQGSLSLRNQLALKQLMCERADLREKYSLLKQDLAQKYAHDVDRYCESKTEFIVDCLKSCGFSAAELNLIRKANNVPMTWEFFEDGLLLQSVDIGQANLVQDIYENSPTYFYRVSGAAPVAGMAAKDMVDVPPTHGEFYFKMAALIKANDRIIGYVDLHLHHRSQGMAYIGLLILREDVQGQGLGRRVYNLVEKFLVETFQVEKIYLGVSNLNQVQGYWEKMGFVPNGYTYSWTTEGVESVCIEMDKRLTFPRLHIERPSQALYPSFLKFVEDMRSNHQTLWSPYIRDEAETPVQFIERLRLRETMPKEGFVPETIYWAVYDGNVVGRISLRHRLEGELHKIGGHVGYEVGPQWRNRGFATKMLSLVLETKMASSIGKLLLTCSPENEASNRTILKNGGQLEKKIFVETIQQYRNHYWIQQNP